MQFVYNYLSLEDGKIAVLFFFFKNLINVIILIQYFA